MGPQPSKQPMDLSTDHPIFRNGKSLTVKDRPYMQAIMGLDEKQYKKWKTSLQTLKINNEYVLLPEKHTFSSEGLCGSAGTVKLDYEFYPYLLSEEIMNKKGKKKLFEEYDIWYLLFALARAKLDMVPAYSKIGDVRPQNIFLNERGSVKVSCLSSWPKEISNSAKCFEGEPTYLAPEELELLSNGSHLENSQSEIFSIGLTLLSAATLDDFLKCYKIQNFFIDQAYIRNSLNSFNQSPAFSDILKGTVNNLVEFNKEKRLTSSQLWNWIGQFEKPILARENFLIADAPEKLHRQVAEIRNSLNPISHHIPQPVHSPPKVEIRNSEIRRSGISGQKLNFPPPVVTSSIMVQGYPGGPVINRIPEGSAPKTDENQQNKQDIKQDNSNNKESQNSNNKISPEKPKE